MIKLHIILELVSDFMDDASSTVVRFIVGIISYIAAFFLPIKNIMHMMLLFFLIDAMMGYYTNHKLYKAKFEPGIIWEKTIKRATFSSVLLGMCCMWDKGSTQEVVSTAQIVGLFISGMLIISFLKNVINYTKWNVFRKLEIVAEKKIEDSINNVHFKFKDDDDKN